MVLYDRRGILTGGNMTITQFLPWILPSMCISAIVTYPYFYVKASARTIKSSKYYVPPEKIVWKVFTVGDICAWVYAIIWMPVFLFVGMNIAASSILEDLSNPYATSDDYKMPIYEYVPIFILLILGPLGSEIVRIFVNNKF
jgi:hypothetical protein